MKKEANLSSSTQGILRGLCKKVLEETVPHGFGGRMWACYQQVVKETVSDLLRAHKMASVVKGAYHPPDD